MTKNEAIEAVLNTAREEIGYHEKASNSQLDDKYANSGSGNWTKYARDLDALGDYYNGPKNGYAYCDVFSDWVFVMTFGAETGREMICQPKYSGGAGCLYSAQYYKDAGQWRTYPDPGDQIFFTYSAGEISHTGIVESVDESYVTTIEGNTSDSVARRKYPLSSGSIVGYGRPRWELVADMDADDIEKQKQQKPAPTPKPSQSVNNGNIILRRGMRSDAVFQLQKNLLALGYDLGIDGADGDFGRNTYNAVVKFQRDHNLEADGEAGPLTLKAIDEALKKQDASGVVQTADGERKFFPIGDIVYSRASVYYSKPDGGSQSYCHSGKALVIGLKKSARYPYQLCKINGGGSNVYGWVAFDTVEKA